MKQTESRATARVVGSALLLITVAIYWPVADFHFVSFDDPFYVTENPAVMKGLTWPSVRWAFLSTHPFAGMPLTTLSFMLDTTLFGLSARAFHLTNLLLHAVNAILFFVVLRRLTGTLWRSALVAALFAWHPLHAEAVAWVSARKDLVSTFFSLLTLWAYTRYAQKSEDKSLRAESGNLASDPRPLTSVPYWLAFVFFVCALMSKPTAVTLPFLLLLFDFWPLRRFQFSTRDASAAPVQSEGGRPSTFPGLLKEKLPFFAASLAGATLSFLMQSQSGTLMSLTKLPLTERTANALISYVRYSQKMFWPTDLAVFYPYPAAWAAWQIIGAAAIVVGVTLLAVWFAKSNPYLAVGWFWFLGMLLPVIGLVQTGAHSIADRYTYLPLNGLFVFLVWGAWDWARNSRHARPVFCAASATALLACLSVTSFQLRHWRDSEALFSHALSVTTDNYVAHNNLGNALARAGKATEAKNHYLAALRIRPDLADAHYNLANHLTREGNLSEALTHYSTAVQGMRNHARVHYNFGVVLATVGRLDEAIAQYRKAARLEPYLAEAHHSLGGALVQQGQTVEGIVHLSEAVRIKPNFGRARNDLGIVLAGQKKFAAAAEQFYQLTRLEPNNADAHYNLASALADQGKFEPAEQELAQVVALQPQDARAFRKLAQFQARGGNVETAIASYREALRLQPDSPEALSELAWILATDNRADIRNGTEAVRLAERACELTERKDLGILRSLDAAYAEAGRFDEAITTARKVRALAVSVANDELANASERRLRRYKSGQPYRQP